MKKPNKDERHAIAAAAIGLICAILTAFSFCSCGVTKATISKPAEGTSTTITITTNNPITTTTTTTPTLNYGN